MFHHLPGIPPETMHEKCGYCISIYRPLGIHGYFFNFLQKALLCFMLATFNRSSIYIFNMVQCYNMDNLSDKMCVNFEKRNISFVSSSALISHCCRSDTPVVLRYSLTEALLRRSHLSGPSGGPCLLL